MTMTFVDDRKSLKIAVTPEAKEAVKAFADRYDMSEYAVASNVYEWFAKQDNLFQRAINGMLHDLEIDAAKAYMERAGGVAGKTALAQLRSFLRRPDALQAMVDIPLTELLQLAVLLHSEWERRREDMIAAGEDASILPPWGVTKDPFDDDDDGGDAGAVAGKITPDKPTPPKSGAGHKQVSAKVKRKHLMQKKSDPPKND